MKTKGIHKLTSDLPVSCFGIIGHPRRPPRKKSTGTTKPKYWSYRQEGKSAPSQGSVHKLPKYLDRDIFFSGTSSISTAKCQKYTLSVAAKTSLWKKSLFRTLSASSCERLQILVVCSLLTAIYNPRKDNSKVLVVTCLRI
jgi:hypothetical protein